MTCLRVIAALVAASILWSTPAAAQQASAPASKAIAPKKVEAPPPKPLWNPAWGDPGWGDVAILAGGAASALLWTGIGPLGEPRIGGIVADESVRDVMRLRDFEDERSARDASDVMLATMTGYPFLVDALIVASYGHKDDRAAWNMTVINIETMALVVGLQRTANAIAHRERPYGRECGGRREAVSHECDFTDRYFSFFSGHSALSFTGAALTCSHHINMPLYGGGGVEAIPCVGGFVIASATATLRMVGDRHYFSDVLVGASVGTLAGFLVPELHYTLGMGSIAPKGAKMTLVPNGQGVSLQGVF